jgi:hypothetical protein
MSIKMNWDLATKRERMREKLTKQSITIPTDEAFWRAWKEDPEAMRASGYRVRKENGQWHAWFER